MTLKESNPKAYDQIYKRPYDIHNIKTENISSEYTEIVYWECDKDKSHIWASHVYIRGDTESDIGCPFCLNKKVSPEGPRLIRSYTVPGSKRNFVKCLWHCNICKSVWENYDIVNPLYESICINCATKNQLKNLSEVNPELRDEWDSSNILDFDDVNEEYTFPVIWNCTECHQNWESTIFERIHGVKKCPYCQGKFPIPNKTSLAALHPYLLPKWNWKKNNRNPEKEFPESNYLAYWICTECHMNYAARICDKVNGKSNGICPNCSSENPISKEVYDYIISELGEINQTNKECLNPMSNVNLSWDCNKCFNRWNASLYDRLYNNKECPYCSDLYAIPGKTSFKALHPALMEEYNIIANILLVDADRTSCNSSQDLWFTCHKCSNSYLMSPKRRIMFQKRKQEPCSFCKGLRRKRRHFI